MKNSSVPSSQRAYHQGISLLRMIFCFVVVFMHLADHSGAFDHPLIYHIEITAVPFFVALSFFLMADFFHQLSFVSLRRRVWRLAWPHLFWAVAYWLVYTAVTLATDRVWVEGVGPLFWQIATGHSSDLNPSMWYQVVLIWLTLLFAALFKLLPRSKAQAALIALAILSLVMQYSGLNRALFWNLRYELAFPLGRVAEVLPHAVLGYFLGCAGKTLRTHSRLIWVGLGLPLAYFLRSRMYHPADFGYAGLPLLLSSLALVVFACQLPISAESRLGRGIAVASRYTLGIYCIHRMVGRILAAVLTAVGLPSGTFLSCVLVYLLCYLACRILAAFPFPQSRKLVD